jgi:hypothetical protein
MTSRGNLGVDADGITQTEADHLMKCPGCHEWLDMRDLGQVLAHVHEAEIQIVERDPAPSALMLLDITDALIAVKAPQATRKQAIDIQAAILAALRKRNGNTVACEGAPAKWRLAS